MTLEGSAIDASIDTWESLAALAERWGPSYYLADLGRFEENARRLVRAFRTRYPRTNIGYSYKANYLPAYILRADALGAYAEVVSSFEYDLARELGIPASRIIFNGPVKRRPDLQRALGAGALVNADSVAEIWEMLRVAEGLGRRAAVGVRVNLGSQADSRFGVDLRAPEALEALKALDASPHLRLSGLHFHYSGDRSEAHYRERTRAVIALHAEVLGGRPLDYLDMGGGFAGAMSPELARQLSSEPASFDDYARAIAGELLAAYGAGGPALIIEPGMALVADTMAFVTRVEAVKARPRPLAVVDGSGLNVQPAWNLFRGINPPMRAVSASRAHARDLGPFDIVGQTCIERDTLYAGYGGPLAAGDYLWFDNVGAYANALNAPFIRGTPPILDHRGTGEAAVLRPGSTAKDLVKSYAGGVT